MSRTRNATTAAAYSYVQIGLAVGMGLVSMPLTLHFVGVERYGLWLAAGELLAYSAMADLGVLSVLPWLVAQAEGRNDRGAVHGLLNNAVWVGAAGGFLYALLAVLILIGLPGLVPGDGGIDPEVRRSLLLLVVLGAAAYPLKAYTAFLNGMQDVRFTGPLALAQVVIGASLLVALLLAGYGLVSVALAAGLPPLLTNLAALLRVRSRHMDAPVLAGWRPHYSTVRLLASQGIGVWLAAFGWRMITATSSLVLLALHGPAAAVIYAATAKMAEMLTQLSWVLPDSALVGVAQLHGAGHTGRIREVTVLLLRLLIVGSGGVAICVLAANANFVGHWVGPSRFGGQVLTTALAANVLSQSLVHGILATCATLGSRTKVGIVTLAQGAIGTGAALVLGRLWGLPGVAAGQVLGALVIAIPAGAVLMSRHAGLDPRGLWTEVVVPWLVRALPVVSVAAALGVWTAGMPLLILGATLPVLALAYLLSVRSLLAGLPLPDALRARLARLRLLTTATQ